MSKFVTMFYNHDGRLIDSTTLNGRAAVDEMRNLFADDARVRILDKNVSVHFSVKDDAKIEAYLSGYLNNEISGLLKVLESWFTAAQAVGGKDYVIKLDGESVELEAYTIGGVLRQTKFSLRNQSAMTAAKIWILSMKGAYLSQKDDGTQVFELHVKKAGLNFLGYLLGLEEIGQWPQASQAEGNAWLTPDAVLVFAQGQLLQYSRYSEGTALALVALAAKTSIVPAPVNRDNQDLDVKFSLEGFTAAFPERVNDVLRSTFMAMVNNFHDVQFALSCTTDLGHIQTILWVGEEGYPLAQDYIANGTSGLNNGTLCEIDRQCNHHDNLLTIHDLPLDLFDIIYAFDIDSAVQFHNDRSELRAKAIVSPTAVALLDNLHVTVIDRKVTPGATIPNAVAYFYHVLLTKYPQRAGAIVDIMACKLRTHDGMQISVRSVGALAEAVDVTIDEHTTQRFAITDVAGICNFITTWDDREDELATREATQPARGQTALFLPVDESATLERIESGMEQVKDGMDVLATLRSTRGAEEAKSYEANEYDPAAAISIPVVSNSGEAMYSAVFIFADAQTKAQAMDIGFGAQVAAKLGMDGYKGTLTANNRIGDLPTIAEYIRKTALSNIPAIRYYREQH